MGSSWRRERPRSRPSQTSRAGGRIADPELPSRARANQVRFISLLLLVATLAASPSAFAQCIIAPEYLAVLAALKPTAPSSIVVAGRSEPGDRLVVEGRVVDGMTPIAGASVYVFQADANGIYRPGSADPFVAEANPRLHGTLRSDSDGRYRVETIRPGAYSGLAAHLHYVVAALGYKTRLLEVQFQDDPILVARLQAGEPQIPQSLRDSPCFKSAPDAIAIRPVRRDAAGVTHVVRDLELFRD